MCYNSFRTKEIKAHLYIVPMCAVALQRKSKFANRRIQINKTLIRLQAECKKESAYWSDLTPIAFGEIQPKRRCINHGYLPFLCTSHFQKQRAIRSSCGCLSFWRTFKR